jgi:type I restriction enzyme S subunit
MRLGGNYRNGSLPSPRPLIKMGNIARIKIDLSKIEYVPNAEKIFPEHLLRYGDVLFNTRNTLDLVGKVSIWRDELPRAYYNSNILRLEFRERYCGSSSYFVYALNSKSSIEALRALATGTTSVAAVYSRDLVKLNVPVPPKREQLRIGSALTDADDIIAVLERLIAKKQAIKQGMMQELLTAKTRLPGFRDRWVSGPLKRFIPLQRGFDLPNSQVRRGNYPVVYSNGIMRRHETAMASGPGVVTGRSGTIGKVHYIAEDYWPHNTALWVTDFSRTDAKFVYYFLTHLGLERFSSGSGVPTLNRNDAHTYEVRMPGSIAEQHAIADVLTDVHLDLDGLHERLAKAISVKQGMMQELLTGRTRLPLTEAVS